MVFPFVLNPCNYDHYRLGPTRLKVGAPAPRSAPMMDDALFRPSLWTLLLSKDCHSISTCFYIVQMIVIPFTSNLIDGKVRAAERNGETHIMKAWKEVQVRRDTMPYNGWDRTARVDPTRRFSCMALAYSQLKGLPRWLKTADLRI